MSRVVVSNVQVLTANTRYDQEEAKEGQAIRSTVVTLMVSPVDAERIALAQAEGQLMLTLRNPLDVDADGVDRREHGGAVRRCPRPSRHEGGPAAHGGARHRRRPPVVVPQAVHGGDDQGGEEKLVDPLK